MDAAAVLEAATRMRDRLLALRSLKPPISATPAAEGGLGVVASVHALVSIDASLIGREGGMLGLLGRIVLHALRLSNYHVELVMGGPRELGSPAILKAASEHAASAVDQAMRRVLMGTGAPSEAKTSTVVTDLSPPLASSPAQHGASIGAQSNRAPITMLASSPAPALVLTFCPPATTGTGIELPLSTASSRVCAALRGARLGYVRLSSSGNYEVGTWSLTDPAAAADKAGAVSVAPAAAADPSPPPGVLPSIDALLEVLATARVSPSAVGAPPWHTAWRAWSAFRFASDEARRACEVAATALTTALKQPSGGSLSSRGLAWGQGHDGGAVMGEDRRGEHGGGAYTATDGAPDGMAVQVAWLSAAELHAVLDVRQEMHTHAHWIPMGEGLWGPFEAL